jgi:hypothetical protein
MPHCSGCNKSVKQTVFFIRTDKPPSYQDEYCSPCTLRLRAERRRDKLATRAVMLLSTVGLAAAACNEVNLASACVAASLAAGFLGGLM